MALFAGEMRGDNEQRADEFRHIQGMVDISSDGLHGGLPL